MIERLNAALEGRYHVQRELGEGGMATVFLAADLKHDRHVALKVLKPELAAVVGAERFLAEIKTTANLQHPHILPLFDSGEADTFLYYVMPYVEGESLRQKLDREKQLSVDEAVALTEKVAGALQYAHDQGVVHRDIKPANILIARDEPLVADFGIALALSEAGGGRITETGLSLGTPHYMSPEQASGDQSLDKRSDVYALGCILYELLTGEPPYGGPTAQSVLAKILTGDAHRVTDLRRTVPPNVDAAVAKALEKLPADRFPSAEAFARALRDPAYRHGQDGAHGRPGPGHGPAAKRRRVATGALAAGALAVGLLLGWLLRPDPAPAGVFRAALEFPEDQRLFDLPYGSSLLLTPDGSQLVYAGPGETQGWRFWVRRADELVATPIRGSDGAGAPVLAPAGDALAYADINDGDLMVIGLRGGTPRKLASLASFVSDWTESGYIYYGDNSLRNMRVRATGGEPEVVPGLANPEDWSLPGSPAWGWGDVLPGEEKGVFSRIASNGNFQDNVIAVVDLETGEYRELAPGEYPRYLPGGHLIWTTTDGTLMAAPFDAGRGEFTATPVALVDGVRKDPSGAATMALSASGDLVYRTGAGPGGSMRVVEIDSSGTQRPIDEDWTLFPAASGNWSGLAVSPDGTRLVVTNGSGGGSQLWVKSLVDEAPPNRITFEGAFHVRPRWLGPDSVLFISTLGGEDRPTQVWAMAADGSGAPRKLAEADVEIEEALVSPDGQWLVYRQGGTTANRDIYALRRDVDSAGRPLIATDADEKSPRLSPDGRWLAYVSDRTGASEVFVRPFPNVNGGRWQISRGGGLSPVWSPDGSRLHYVAGDGMLTAARLRFSGTSVAVTRRDPLLPVGEGYIDLNYPVIEMTPDGERFLLLSFESENRGQVVWVRNWIEEWERRRSEASR